MKAAEVVRAIKAPVVHGTWSEVAVLPPWVLQVRSTQHFVFFLTQ